MVLGGGHGGGGVLYPDLRGHIDYMRSYITKGDNFLYCGSFTEHCIENWVLLVLDGKERKKNERELMREGGNDYSTFPILLCSTGNMSVTYIFNVLFFYSHKKIQSIYALSEEVPEGGWFNYIKKKFSRLSSANVTQ